MAQVADLSGIKQLIQPLEASGVLVKRTDDEVSLACLIFFFILNTITYTYRLINLSCSP